MVGLQKKVALWGGLVSRLLLEVVSTLVALVYIFFRFVLLVGLFLHPEYSGGLLCMVSRTGSLSTSCLVMCFCAPLPDVVE